MKWVPARLSVFLSGIAKNNVWIRATLVAGAVLPGGIPGNAQSTPVTTTSDGGTTSRIPKFPCPFTIGDSSAISEINGDVGIGTASPLMSTLHLVS